MIRSLVLVALFASASMATSLPSCRKAYGNSVAANTREARCKALVELGNCINSNLAAMTQNERLNAQGFFDAVKLTSSCADYVVPTVNVALLASSELGTGSGASMFRERRAADTVSIWDINDRFDEFSGTIVNKATLAAVQTTVNDLQAGNSAGMNKVRSDIQNIVNDRLTTLANQIQAAMDTTVSSLQSVTSTINDVTMARIAKLESDIKGVTTSVADTLVKQVTADTDANRVAIAAVAATAATVDRRVTTLDNSTDSIVNVAVADTKVNADKLWTAFAKTPFIDRTIPVFRYNTWFTYSNNHGWYCGDNNVLFGGVNPSTWTDGNGYAHQISSDKNLLRTLFSKKQWGGPNAMIQAHEWYYYSSTTGQVAGALFRIRNTQATAVTWRTFFYFSSYSSWGEMASVAMNGVNLWTYAGTCGGSCTQNIDISIPANRISTIIFISTSGGPNGSRSNLLAFYNNCLTLPSGLEYVDDLDYATGGWEA